MQRDKTFGKHYVVDYFDCDPEILKYVAPIREILLRAARESGATLLGDHFHQFEPFGTSGVILIAESHFAVHTWPENAYAGLDIFTCGASMDAQAGIEIVGREVRAGEVQVKILHRGLLDRDPHESPRRG